MILCPPGLATKNREIQEVRAVHDAWALAFEGADINAAETLWSHDGDVLFVTPRGTVHKGFAEVKAALNNLFEAFGKTTLDISDVFLTVDGDDATITMSFQWSPVPGRVFPVIERYRKVAGEWKLHTSQTQGNLLPLRPEACPERSRRDEKAIKQLAKQVQGGLLDKDIPAIAEWVADDFTYVATDGTAYLGWQPSVKALAADVELIADLQLQSISLMGDSACARGSLTRLDGKTRNCQFTFVGLNWKLALIHLNPEAESFAVEPSGKRSTTWGQVKEEK